MDIRRDGFFGYLTLNGKAVPLSQNLLCKGSLMSLMGETLKSLSAAQARTNADGDLNIMLRISNKPIDTSERGLATFNRASEVEALLDSANPDQPDPGEEYGEFFDRLITQGYSPSAAEMIASQWFNRPINPETSLWLNDPKAIRFRELNARDEAYESALPEEYERLKNYVKTTYPEFVEHLTFRTA